MNILTKILRVLAIPQYRTAVLRTRVAASTEHDRILQGLGLDTVVDIGAPIALLWYWWTFFRDARRGGPKAPAHKGSGSRNLPP